MRLRLFTVGETEVYVHAGTAFFAVYGLLTGAWPMLLATTGSILLHEIAHGAAAWLCGQPPRELELTPLGAVLRLEDEENLSLPKRLCVLASGPVMTLLLCVVALQGAARGLLSIDTGRALFSANLALLLLNLLPALPLDGGRMLALLLSLLLRQETVRRVMRITGTALGLAAIGGSVALAWRYGSWNWSLAAVGCFLMYSAATATTTMVMHQLQELMARKTLLEGRGHLSVRRVAILAGLPLHRAIRLLAPQSLTELTLMELGTLKPLGLLTEERLIACYLDSPQMSCLEAMQK